MKVLTLADSHTGSRFGLTPPGRGDDKDRELTGKLFDWFFRMMKKLGPFDLTVLNGDLVEGPGKKSTLDLITSDVGEQAEMFLEIAQYIPTKSWKIIQGTPYHAESVLKHEAMIAKELGTELIPLLRMEIEGVKLNYRHTGHRSDTAYAQGTQTTKPAVKDEIRMMRQGKEAADIYFRSHVHYYDLSEWRSGNKTRRSYLTPCLKYPFDGHGVKLDPARYDIGVLVHEYRDGQMVKEEKEWYNWEVEWTYEKVTKK